MTADSDNAAGHPLVYVSAGRIPRAAAGDRVPASVILVDPELGQTEVPVVATRAGFGGHRLWFVCPGCRGRVGRLFLYAPGPRCRRCTRIPYPTRQHHRKGWWEAWGRAAHRLARVRLELARPYLRLARRGRLERLEARLEREVCRGLTTEFCFELEWRRSAALGVPVGIPPFGMADELVAAGERLPDADVWSGVPLRLPSSDSDSRDGEARGSARIADELAAQLKALGLGSPRPPRSGRSGVGRATGVHVPRGA
jgi:hypothetical protein